MHVPSTGLDKTLFSAGFGILCSAYRLGFHDFLERTQHRPQFEGPLLFARFKE